MTASQKEEHKVKRKLEPQGHRPTFEIRLVTR